MSTSNGYGAEAWVPSARLHSGSSRSGWKPSIASLRGSRFTESTSACSGYWRSRANPSIRDFEASAECQSTVWGEHCTDAWNMERVHPQVMDPAANRAHRLRPDWWPTVRIALFFRSIIRGVSVWLLRLSQNRNRCI